MLTSFKIARNFFADDEPFFEPIINSTAFRIKVEG